jgi:Alpha amylase, catalytic domain
MSYDISDYQDVDTTVGSLDSWRSFMAAAKARNLKVINMRDLSVYVDFTAPSQLGTGNELSVFIL